MLLWTMEISIWEKHHILMSVLYFQLIKHRILMRSVLSADKTLHTNKKELYQYKVTARDVLSTIW